jgi:aminoglycoside 2'-N-acetyltransferase I
MRPRRATVAEVRAFNVTASMTTPLDIRVRRTRQIDAALRATIVELCTEAHGADFSRLFFYLPTDGLHFIAYRGDQIVSHAVVTTRWVQPERLPVLRTAYVAAAATLPAYQRRGYGSAVMHELTAHITNYDLACLETDRITFYERLGWQRWRGPRVGRSGTELIPTPDHQNIMILRLANTPPLDLDRLLTIEAQAGRIW